MFNIERTSRRIVTNFLPFSFFFQYLAKEIIQFFSRQLCLHPAGIPSRRVWAHKSAELSALYLQPERVDETELLYTAFLSPRLPFLFSPPPSSSPLSPLSLRLRIRYVFLDTQIVDDARRKLRRKVAS